VTAGVSRDIPSHTVTKLSGQHHDLSLPEDQIPREGALLAGKYRIEQRLGAGGMGVVLAARHEAINQRVAIKFLVVADEAYRDEAIQRLLREARAAAALRGEHVVRVYDIGELPDGAPFIVMEHLDGKDLAAVASAVGKLPVSEAVMLVAQAASAVSEAHRAGIIHRDLKPSNLFVVRRPDGTAAIKVLDFGIAKSLDPMQPQPLTGARVVLGTAHYMSPEQIRDSHTVDARSDVWSLGAILYELVAGRPAFQSGTQSGVYAAIVTESPPPLSSLRPDAPLALQQVLSQCLERDPQERIQSAEALAEMLAPFAARSVEYDRLLERSLPSPLLSEWALLASGGTSISPTLPTPSAPGPALPPVERSDTQVSFGATNSPVEPNQPLRELPALSGFQRTKRSSSLDGVPASPVSSVLRRSLVAVGLVGGLALTVLVLLRFARLEPSLVEPSAALTIESIPPGARVRDGARILGVTPVKIPLGSATGAPRSFTLELGGYQPYTLAPAGGAAVAHVELTPLPALPRASASRISEPALAASSAPSVAARRPAARENASLRSPPRPSTSSSSSPEIRLNR
jgi:serine/threonine protein kinase